MVTKWSTGAIDHDNMACYDVVLEPWLKLLAHNSDCQSFQNTKPQEILAFFINKVLLILTFQIFLLTTST